MKHQKLGRLRATGSSIGEQMQRLSPTCQVCLDLKPNHHPPSPWRLKVAGDMLIEHILDFSFSALGEASHKCFVCSTIHTGLTALSCGPLKSQLTGLADKKCSFVIVNNAPVETVIAARDNGDVVRIQFFCQECRWND